MRTYLSVVAAIVAINVAPALHADSTDYVVLRMPGFDRTNAWAVNDRGDVVGTAGQCGSFADVGFLYRNGEYSVIAVPGADWTQPTAINERGVVVGYFRTAGVLGTFRYWRGRLEIIQVPGYDLVPQGINNRGDIIGWYPADPEQPYKSFLLTSAGEFSVLPEPDDSENLQAWGVNSAGVIVGTGYSVSGGDFSFTYRRGELALVFGGPMPYGINDRGHTLASLAGVMGVYRHGEPVPLQHPEPTYFPLDISNTWLVGSLPAVQTDGCFENAGFMLRLK